MNYAPFNSRNYCRRNRRCQSLTFVNIITIITIIIIIIIVHLELYGALITCKVINPARAKRLATVAIDGIATTFLH